MQGCGTANAFWKRSSELMVVVIVILQATCIHPKVGTKESKACGGRAIVQTALIADTESMTAYPALMPYNLPAGEDAWMSVPFPEYLQRRRVIGFPEVTLSDAIRLVSEAYDVPIIVPQDPKMQHKLFEQARVWRRREERSLRECLVELISQMQEWGMPRRPGTRTRRVQHRVVAVVKPERVEILRVDVHGTFYEF